MDGTIWFQSAEALAEFLKAFTGSTATFKVTQDAIGYRLTFTGGY